MALLIELPTVTCTNCMHSWVPRSHKVRKCPFCQRSDHLSIVNLSANPRARELIGMATEQEIEDLATVLRILRGGDFIYADAVRRAIAIHREQEAQMARAARVRRKTITR